MPSNRAVSEPEPSLARLAGHATAVAAKYSVMPVDGDLAPVVAAMEHRASVLLAYRATLRHELACGTPPPTLVAALSRPRGMPCRVRLAIHGRSTTVVVHPLGVESVERACAVWQSLTRYIHTHDQAA